MTSGDLTQITGGNPEALEFIQFCGEYLRAADNLMDDGNWTSDRILACLALGHRFYSCAFYRRHREHFQMLTLMATNLWGVSVDWEHRDELWKRQWADVLRHIDVAVYGAVCLICRGWVPARDFSRAFLSSAYIDHVDKHGVPTERGGSNPRVQKSFHCMHHALDMQLFGDVWQCPKCRVEPPFSENNPSQL